MASNPVRTLWYYAGAKNEAVGPLTFVELESLARHGTIRPETFIAEAGGSLWRKFAAVQGLHAQEAISSPIPEKNQSPIAHTSLCWQARALNHLWMSKLGKVGLIAALGVLPLLGIVVFMSVLVSVNTPAPTETQEMEMRRANRNKQLSTSAPTENPRRDESSEILTESRPTQSEEQIALIQLWKHLEVFKRERGFARDGFGPGGAQEWWLRKVKAIESRDQSSSGTIRASAGVLRQLGQEYLDTHGEDNEMVRFYRAQLTRRLGD